MGWHAWAVVPAAWSIAWGRRMGRNALLHRRTQGIRIDAEVCSQQAGSSLGAVAGRLRRRLRASGLMSAWQLAGTVKLRGGLPGTCPHSPASSQGLSPGITTSICSFRYSGGNLQGEGRRREGEGGGMMIVAQTAMCEHPPFFLSSSSPPPSPHYPPSPPICSTWGSA